MAWLQRMKSFCLKSPRTLTLCAVMGLLAVAYSPSSQAIDRRGRLGVGFSQQLQNDIPAISFKLQKSRAFAFSGMFGIDTDDDAGGYGAGLKFYRIIFEEPQLNFYFAGLGALINKKRGNAADDDGFQADFSLGSEFSFAGLKSLGLSFEFGVSMSKLDEFRVQTLGNHFISGEIHFYL